MISLLIHELLFHEMLLLELLLCESKNTLASFASSRSKWAMPISQSVIRKSSLFVKCLFSLSKPVMKSLIHLISLNKARKQQNVILPGKTLNINEFWRCCHVLNAEPENYSRKDEIIACVITPCAFSWGKKQLRLIWSWGHLVPVGLTGAGPRLSGNWAENSWQRRRTEMKGWFSSDFLFLFNIPLVYWSETQIGIEKPSK